MSLFDLSGKVAVVTGGSRGIGRAIAMEIAAAGGKATAFACNIGHKPQLEALVAHATEAHGKIDILIPNAAINPHYGPSQEIPDDLWTKTLASNLTSTHWLCQMVLPGMAERGGGAVVILSSVVAVYGSDKLGAYAVSKAAEAQLARNLALEWGPRGIRVNSIAPGVIKTDFAKALYENPKAASAIAGMTCLKRLGEPDDIAGVAVFLASSAAKYVTGQLLLVDGGASIYSAIG